MNVELQKLDGTLLTMVFLRARGVADESYFWRRHVSDEELDALELEWQDLQKPTQDRLSDRTTAEFEPDPTWDASWPGTYGQWFEEWSRVRRERDLYRTTPRRLLVESQRSLFIGAGATAGESEFLFGSRSLRGDYDCETQCGRMTLGVLDDVLYAYAPERNNLDTVLARAKVAGDRAYGLTVAENANVVSHLTLEELLCDFLEPGERTATPLLEALGLDYSDSLDFAEQRRAQLLGALLASELWPSDGRLQLCAPGNNQFKTLLNPATTRTDTESFELCEEYVDVVSGELTAIILNAEKIEEE
jgi:hypothetical protein